MVLGEKEQVIYGKGYIEDVLCGHSVYLLSLVSQLQHKFPGVFLIKFNIFNSIFSCIRHGVPSFKIKTYDEDMDYGLLRHVMVRTGHATGQIMVTLVLADPVLPSKKNFVRELLKLHKCRIHLIPVMFRLFHPNHPFQLYIRF